MFYIFVCLIILGCVLNYISKKYTLSKVSYKRELSKKYVETGEEFYISTAVDNKKILPVTFLQVTEKFPIAMQYKFKADKFLSKDNIYHTITMTLLPYQRIKREYAVKFNERGKFLLRSVTMTSGDLLGLNTTVQEVDCNDEVVVYPKALDISSEVTYMGEFIGDISVKRWIVDDPLVTASIREYTGFEPEKTIHWPSSLKSGKLMVRNFDYTSDNSIFIILNIECSKPFWAGIDKKSIEKCYSLVRALMDEFEKQHIKYGFTTNAQIIGYFSGEDYFRPSLGQDHYYNILDSLGCADYDISVTFEKLISNAISWHISCKTYLIITPAILESYIEHINKINNYADKTALFSIETDNMEKIKESIVKYIVKEN